jgi:hypothetical protein
MILSLNTSQAVLGLRGRAEAGGEALREPQSRALVIGTGSRSRRPESRSRSPLPAVHNGAGSRSRGPENRSRSPLPAVHNGTGSRSRGPQNHSRSPLPIGRSPLTIRFPRTGHLHPSTGQVVPTMGTHDGQLGKAGNNRQQHGQLRSVPLSVITLFK